MIINTNVRYQILSFILSDITKNNFELTLNSKEEEKFLIAHDDSLFDDQLRRICNIDVSDIKTKTDIKISQVILVEAKKNPKKNALIEKLISDGFTYNKVHYVRYGKSGSQGKEGITLFIDEKVYEEMFKISQLGMEITECVTSKYESQRNLILSTCTLINENLPYIVIVDEYTKTMKQQNIRYVVEEPSEIVDKVTGEIKTINVRRIKEGLYDIQLSPFDGCGCHDKSMSEMWSKTIGLEDYTAIGYQIRLPFFKGYSVEFPFKEYYKSIGVTKIQDVFGKWHNVNDIDCIWNISMWKGYGIFKKKYGNEGWVEYLKSLDIYMFKLGISKYSHHKKDFNLKTRMNYQYLQCLNLWNQKYIDWFTKRPLEHYDILDESNWGNMVKLASYSTNLYEKVIKGDKLYSYKFLGMEDTATSEANGKYLEAVLINDNMLKDVAVKQFIHRKLKKKIDQMKYGKIYADGYYHTVVGDMIGYLQYVAGKDIVGCLNAKEFYANTIPYGKVLSFRSPLVCPSEVNDVTIVTNDLTKKWCSHFKDQDVAMINMYDLSAPQQGGMDEDGDAVYLCFDPYIVNQKIEKTMIIDVEDKATAKVKPYNAKAILEYEMNSRDNRIGEITTVATGISNQYTINEKYKQINDDNISLLRIFQGKEIDFIKTGLRWNMNKGLRKQGQRIPYFLLYNYPKKLELYQRMKKKNKNIELREDKINLNAYQSPSALNELCDYVITWERKKVMWDKSCLDTRCLIVDNKLNLSDRYIRSKIKHIINEFAVEWRELNEILDDVSKGKRQTQVDKTLNTYRDKLKRIVKDEVLLANYVIEISYSNNSLSKTLAWSLFGEVIISNLKSNTPKSKNSKIIEAPYHTDKTFEYLGKYYELIEE